MPLFFCGKSADFGEVAYMPFMETTSINVKIKTNKTISLLISYLLYIFVPPAKALNGEGIKFSFEAFIEEYTEITVYSSATQKAIKTKLRY